MSWSWVGLVAGVVYVAGAVVVGIIAWIEEDEEFSAVLVALTWPTRLILRIIQGRW